MQSNNSQSQRLADFLAGLKAREPAPPKSHLSKELARRCLLDPRAKLYPGMLIRVTRSWESIRRTGADERLAFWASRYYNLGHHHFGGSARVLGEQA